MSDLAVRVTEPIALKARLNEDWLAVVIGLLVFAAALVSISGALISHASAAGIVGLLVGSGGMCLVAVNWVEFRWQSRRRLRRLRHKLPPQTMERYW